MSFTAFPLEILHAFRESGCVEGIVEKLESCWGHGLKENLNIAEVLHKVTDRVFLAEHREFDQSFAEASALEMHTLLPD